MPRYAVGAAMGLLGVGVVWLVVLGCGAAEPAAKKPKGDGFASDRAPAAVACRLRRGAGHGLSQDRLQDRPAHQRHGRHETTAGIAAKTFRGLSAARFPTNASPARQHSENKDVAMANLIVSWHPEKTRRVILCSHYDTRPIADQEPNRRRWHDAFHQRQRRRLRRRLADGNGQPHERTRPGRRRRFRLLRRRGIRLRSARRRVFLRLQGVRQAVPQGQGSAALPRRRAAGHGGRQEREVSRREEVVLEGARSDARNSGRPPTNWAARRSVPTSSASSRSRTITSP